MADTPSLSVCHLLFSARGGVFNLIGSYCPGGLFAGGGLGLAVGLFLGSFDTPLMQDTMTGKQQFIYQAKQMGRRSWSNCKTFAVMGLIFSAAECIVEKVCRIIF